MKPFMSNTVLLWKRFFLVIIIFLPVNLFAQSDRLNFEHVSEQHNCSHFSINSIVQDKKGFLWIATRNGITIFDSYDFTDLKGQKSKISSDIIKILFVDSNGDIWIGTPDGVNKYCYNEKKILHFSNKPDDKSSICGNEITGFAEDKFGNLWIGTNSGLSRYDKKNNKFVNYFSVMGNKKTLQSNMITAVYIDKDNNMFLGYKGLLLDMISLSNIPENIEKMNQNDLPVRHFALNGAVEPAMLITKIHRDMFNNMWAATNSSGVFTFDLKDQNSASQDNITKIKGINYNEKKSKIKLSSNNVSDLIEDKESNIFIGTFGGGLNVLNRARTKIKRYYFDPNDFYCVSDNYIRSLFIDYIGNVWIGCNTAGLNKYSPYKYKFNIYRSNPFDKTSLKKNQTTAIYEDNDGVIWIGLREGLNRFDRKNNSEIFYYKSKEFVNANSNKILSICPDNSGNLWIGTYDGVNCFNKNKKEYQDYNDELQKFLKKKIIRTLTRDRENNLWIGSSAGLIKYNLTNNKYTVFVKDPNDSNSIISNYIWYIFVDNFDNIWIATNLGLCRMKKETNNFARYVFKSDGRVNSLDNLVTYINQDRNNVIWFGTYSSGLHKIEPKYYGNSGVPNYDNSIVEHFNMAGIVKECVNGILNDQDDNLWLCSDLGITMINSKRDQFRTYNTKDGLIPNEYSTASCYGKYGEFFFGGQNGMVSFIPNKIKINEKIPKIALTSFKIHYNEVCSGIEASDLNNIELGYTQNEFTFNFAVLDYTENTNNQYKYKLEGYNDDWIDCGNKNEVTFMNLKGGEYTLRVIGSNNDKKWNLAGLNIKIKVNLEIGYLNIHIM